MPGELRGLDEAHRKLAAPGEEPAQFPEQLIIRWRAHHRGATFIIR
jgi:hypothetical protein